jgi:hypothetical protein
MSEGMMRRLPLMPVQFMVHSSNNLGSNAQGLMFIKALFLAVIWSSLRPHHQ